MAATGLTDIGRERLFTAGWTTEITKAWLYTSSDVLVDTQNLTMTHTTGTATLVASADIVFNVAASTNDVAYIQIGALAGEIKSTYYTKTLSTTYDFVSAGTLTVDSFVITLTGSSLTADGKDELWTVGFETITGAKLYDTIDALLDTQTVSFTATETLDLDSAIVFDVATGKTAEYVTLINTSADVLYNRILDATYPFTTAGTLTISEWSLAI
jgi:hypothetical protein